MYIHISVSWEIGQKDSLHDWVGSLNHPDDSQWSWAGGGGGGGGGMDQ